MTDKIEQAQARISTGLTGEFLRIYVDGAIESPWRVTGSVMVIRDLEARGRGSDRAIVHVAATTPHDPMPVGAKISVPLDVLPPLEDIGAELALLLQQAISARKPAASCIRFALTADGVKPTRGSEGASGYDLHSPRSLYIPVGTTVVVHCGVIVELPAGLEGQVRGRSSMAKRGLHVATGTIDSDFRGVIGATITNLAQEAQKIEAGDRIAQIVIARVEHREWIEIDAAEMTTTARGAGGFGSTGR